MKKNIRTAVISTIFLIAASASAQSVSIRPQSHPLRIRMGMADSGNPSLASLGFSYDIGVDQQANRLSLYGDSFGDIFSENAWGTGLSLRHELPIGWFGLGIGNYASNEGVFSPKKSQGLGGKVFIGSGKGSFFIEASANLMPKRTSPVSAFMVGMRF
ncbi:hypothetical protein [Armatimonas sp.]|uniref:hypothetical protein n=1 Tax=Armatimonas sp. TaxID=1872638 RepID=UPI003752D9AA